MLDTMRPKDLSDADCKVLKEHLQIAMQFKSDFKEEIFVKGILAPRVATEKITPYRKALSKMFDEEIKEAFRRRQMG